MKKLLALVLALVMSMSLVTISNAAFKDADKIDYKEAVDVMNAVGVFIGDEKGNFNAKENLTREQAAKIIAYLELGDKAADALVGGATFTDVASTRWSAGFVGYCAQAGVVAGVGDSKFDPAGQLTALQFGKMLLVELGYDAKAAGMVGADWAINTSKLMAKAKLMDKIDGSVNQVLTREKAAQMTLNALKAPTVEYSTKGSSIIVNGAEINLGASEPTYVTNTVAKEQTISKQQLTNNGGYTIELGEKLYKDLKLNRTTDDFARPANQWFNKTTKIGTYADKADLTYTASVKNGAIYADLGLGKKVAADDVTLYVDGVAAGHIALVKGGDTTLDGSGNGVVTEVYYNADTNTADIIHINTYLGEVVKTVAATASKDTHIVIDAQSEAPTLLSGKAFNRDFETEVKFEDDAVVYYTYSAAANEIKSVAVCETATGVVTEAQNKVTDGMKSQNVTIDGTQYKAGKKFVGVEVGSGMLKGEYDVYLDSNGYMLKIEETEVTAGNYALLINARGENNFDTNRAVLLFADGTKKVVDTAKDYSTTATKVANRIANNTIVSYREDDGVYTLKALTTLGNDATNEAYGTTDAFVLTSSKATVTLDSTTATANSASIFVVTDDDSDITAYTGIKNAPAITSSDDHTVKAYYYCKSGKMITVMFIFADNEIIKGTANKSIFFAKDSASNLISNSTGTYYNYNVVTADGITTVKVDESLGKELSGLYSNYSVNSKGVIVSVASGASNGFTAFSSNKGANDSYLTGCGIAKTSKEYTVTLDTKNVLNSDGSVKDGKLDYVITVAKDAKIYYVDGDGVITESSYGGIMADANDDVYAYVDEYQVEKLFIEINSDDEPDADKVVIDAANYRVDFTGTAIKVDLYKGLTAAQKGNVAVLAQIKAAMEADGYSKFVITETATGKYKIEATKGNVLLAFTWDSTDATAGKNECIKVKVDGKDYLVDEAANVDDILSTVSGTHAKATKANGDAAGYVNVTSDTLTDGYKYETGYVTVTKSGTKAAKAVVTGVDTVGGTDYAKIGATLTVKADGEDIKVTTTGADLATQWTDKEIKANKTDSFKVKATVTLAVEA